MVDCVSPKSAESVFIVAVAVSSWSVRAVASGESVALPLAVCVVQSACCDAGCALSAVVLTGSPPASVACLPRADCVDSVLSRLVQCETVLRENPMTSGIFFYQI